MGLATTNEEIEFMHNDFQMNVPDKLKLIKRKMPSKNDIASLKIDDVQDIYQEITSIKNKQIQFNQFLAQLKHQNQVLWNEIRLERQKHEQQREMLNKMFGFLVSIVKNKKVVFDQGGVKRKAPMILDNAPKKIPKTTDDDDDDDLVNFPDESSSPMPGPQIFEICDEIAGNSSLPQGSPQPEIVSSDSASAATSTVQTSQPLQQQIQQAFQLPIQIPAQLFQNSDLLLQPPQQQTQQPQQSQQITQEELDNEQQQQTQDLLNLAMEELQNEDFIAENSLNGSVSDVPILPSNISNPITDLVLSNPNNLSIVPNPNYQ